MYKKIAGGGYIRKTWNAWKLSLSLFFSPFFAFGVSRAGSRTSGNVY